MLGALEESLLVERGAKIALPLARVQLLLPQDVVDECVLVLVFMGLGC